MHTTRSLICVTLPYGLVAVLATTAPSRAGGRDFEQIAPHGWPYYTSFSSVDALSTSDAWAVGWFANEAGTKGGPLIEHRTRRKWQRLDGPSPGRSQRYYGVSGSSPDDVWAVGEFYRLDEDHPRTLVAHWDGATWRRVISPNSRVYGSLAGVSALSPTDAWAVGQLGRRSAILHWDGAAWTSLTFPRPSGGATLLAISASSSRDVWAIGEHHSGTESRPFAVHWDGSVWTVERCPIPPDVTLASLAGIDVASPQDAWAVGYYRMGDRGTHPLLEHWKGSSWTQWQGRDVNDYSGLSGVVIVSARDVWAVGSTVDPGGGFPVAVIEHFDGRSWTLYGGEIDAALHAVDATAPADAWTVGTAYGRYEEGPFGVMRHWNGRQWRYVKG